MNILIPDSWLREYLKTDATPKQVKECLSLSGPSVERITEVQGELVYDIEITSNRPDAMSVSGVAREASVILPRFGIPATFQHDPYAIRKPVWKTNNTLELSITTDSILNPRFSAVILDKIQNTESSATMQTYLTLSGMRPINAVVDVTNYLMKAYGQPVHAFDFDQILPNKKGVPTMILRASKKHEKITTLDGKTHILPGDDIVIEDGSGRLIDLCGIMGGGVSHISSSTNRIVLFVQTYDPTHIRKTSMALSHRTEAAGLFEKGTDTELVMPTLIKGAGLIAEMTGAIVSSAIYDIYPHPYSPTRVSVSKTKLSTYLGMTLTDSDIQKTLIPLGFTPKITHTDIAVLVPSHRRDVSIDVDIIEEIARIYGYHALPTKLPDTQIPLTFEDPILQEEIAMKHTLKGMGFSEIVSYSMLSEKQMDIFKFPKNQTYEITNPLSSEWVYMRPSLLPNMLSIISENSARQEHLKIFELSMIYEYKKNALPQERPMLILGAKGREFHALKGIAERLFRTFGITFPKDEGTIPNWFTLDRTLSLGSYGCIGEIHPEYLQAFDITHPVTILELDFQQMCAKKKPTNSYTPIPKYPSSFEDIALIVPENTLVGPMILDIKQVHTLITNVTLLDAFQNTRTFHITYQSPVKNLTAEDIQPIRTTILDMVASKYQATLKTSS